MINPIPKIRIKRTKMNSIIEEIEYGFLNFELMRKGFYADNVN